jgi:class 3 adenylate cyclase/tetratricopeptide (TPR) repeat protein
VNCPKCDTDNRAAANYCKQCGFLLAVDCPRCRSPLPGAAFYCDHCGLQLVDPAGGSGWWADPQAASSPLARTAPAREGKPDPGQFAASGASERKPQDQGRAEAGYLPAAQRAVPASQPAARPPVTARESQLDQYIPHELMAKLQAARLRGEMVGERRVVTMLFCDVKGSTAAAEGLDPEEWTDIINGAFKHMIQPIYRYEGTVARLMGDGILAFFGAPIAHEDDPQRAVLAGLDILSGIHPYREEVRRKYEMDIDVRVGINTGLVVVGAVGSDLRMEYTAQGDAINLAARMEQTARPGTVQVSFDTYKLVKNLFSFEELGGIEVKGRSEPVLAYRLLGRKRQAGRVRGIEGLQAEMVGRQEEMATLRTVMEDLAQGVGRIVSVLGEAGLGKSRLVNEIQKEFDRQAGGGSDWFETLSLSYESNQAYGTFQRLIRRAMGIAFDDSPAQVREKLAVLLETIPQPARPRAQQVFEALFGIEEQTGGRPLESETFKRELLEAMQAWWRGQFSNRPAVLVFDDMHWSDAPSIELLRQLLSLTEEIPLVLLFAFRNERQAPAWGIKMAADSEFSHRYTEINLRPLSETESNELVDRLLENAELPARLRENILDKSAGNPFFIEEVVRTLIDTGVVVPEERSVNGALRRTWRTTGESADFAIPDNLQSLLSSRLDRLEEATRSTLQVASVIGRSFYRRVLQAVDEASTELDRHLGTLIRMDMIREAARLPEIEYAFRNPLTQEAVYKTILHKHRRSFHRRVGEAIEALYPDRLEGLFGVLAYHFSQAGEDEKAITYYRQAARQSVAVYAYDEAVHNLGEALERLSEGLPAGLQAGLLEELGDVYRLVRDFSQALNHYQAALDRLSADSSAEDIQAIRLHRKIVEVVTEAKWSVDVATYRQVSEIREESLERLRNILPELQSQPADPETARLLAALSVDAWRNLNPPDWERAQKFAEQATAVAEGLADPVLLSQTLGVLASTLDGRSRLRDHLQTALRRLETCQEERFEDQRESIDALRGAGAAWMYVGEYEQALEYLEKAESLSARLQATDQQANAVGLQAQCLFRLDRWDEVLGLEKKWRDLERRYTRARVGET